jgi:hypothetical protein
MKFQYDQTCTWVGHLIFTTTGDSRFPSAECVSCGSSGHLIDPLSPSVVADRLIHRSKAELEGGDYSQAILLAAIAVETFLTQIFLKLKGMEHFAGGFRWPDEEQEAKWEQEYPRSGGFIGPANFVAKRLVQSSFDEFITAIRPQSRSLLRCQILASYRSPRFARLSFSASGIGSRIGGM